MFDGESEGIEEKEVIHLLFRSGELGSSRERGARGEIDVKVSCLSEGEVGMNSRFDGVVLEISQKSPSHESESLSGRERGEEAKQGEDGTKRASSHLRPRSFGRRKPPIA